VQGSRLQMPEAPVFRGSSASFDLPPLRLNAPPPIRAVGFQFMGLGNPQPALTANLFPLNLGLDLGDLLTLTIAGGLALSLDLTTGRLMAGPQSTGGLTIKLGKPNSPLW
jgi:hypothetical protein